MSLLRIVYQPSCQGTRGGTAGQDDRVFGVGTPLYEQVAREAGLKIRRAHQYHLKTNETENYTIGKETQNELYL